LSLGRMLAGRWRWWWRNESEGFEGESNPGMTQCPRAILAEAARKHLWQSGGADLVGTVSR